MYYLLFCFTQTWSPQAFALSKVALRVQALLKSGTIDQAVAKQLLGEENTVKPNSSAPVKRKATEAGLDEAKSDDDIPMDRADADDDDDDQLREEELDDLISRQKQLRKEPHLQK